MSRDYFTKQRGGYVNDDVCVTLFHLSPNVVTLWSLLHLRPNVITFRSLLHLRPNVITFRSLLHLRSVITFRSSTTVTFHGHRGKASAMKLLVYIVARYWNSNHRLSGNIGRLQWDLSIPTLARHIACLKIKNDKH